jgi:hypothetical protein
VTSFGNYCFSRCSSLATLAIPASVTSFGIACFYGCSSLTTLSIPPSVSQIGENVFKKCFSLQNFSISFQYLPKIKPNQWGSELKSFFPHASSDIFIECPFNSKSIN